MAWVFGDGMNRYTATTDIAKKWSTYQEGYGSTISVGAYGRLGRNGVRVSGPGSNQISYLYKWCMDLADKTTAILGVAVKYYGVVYDPSNPNIIFQLQSHGDNQIGVSVNSDGTLSIRRGNARSGTVLATSTNAVTVDTWYYVEFKTVINGSTGTYELRVDTVPWIDLATGKNTLGATLAEWDGVFIGSTATAIGAESGHGNYYCDFYACDGSGTSCNTFLGDIRGDVYAPVSPDGGHTDWTCSTGSDHYEMVNEAGSDNGATDYVQATAVNNIDTYVVEDLTTGAAPIVAVQVLLAAKKEIAPGEMVTVLRTGGGDQVSTTALVPSIDTFKYLIQAYEKDPFTTAAWSESGFNAMEFGMKRTV